MTQREQIEEMAMDVCESYYKGICHEDGKQCDFRCGSFTEAQYLYEKGYRKLSENVRELPCKVGDTLYVISQMKDKRFLPFINEYEVTSISIKKKSIVVWHEMDGFMKNFRSTDFGKTIFLSKEEAERVVTDNNVGVK